MPSRGAIRTTRRWWKNHLHLLVNGAYLPAELELDDERFEMLQKLLSRAFPRSSRSPRRSPARWRKRPACRPIDYKTDNVTPVGTSGYVYARNLMATRLYHCPTVYLEPYVMNSREVFARVQAGDYEGDAGSRGEEAVEHLSRSTSDGVVDGVLEYFKKARPL